MGLLETDDKHCLLGADQLIGREPTAGVRLDDDSVSWRHASLRWTGQAWELQDLGSRNGTFLDGHRIASGARALLRLGCELRFGELPEIWRLTCVEAPRSSVVDVATGERIFALDDLIALPSPAEPELFISRESSGEWVAECGERVWEPSELEVLTLRERRYRFEPGAPVYATSAGRGDLILTASLTLEFAVTRNEEHVEVAIVHRERRIALRPRAHGYLLLTLARLRLKDQAESTLPAESQGWVYQERLVKMLATTPTQLAVDIYRARRQFGEAGVLDPSQIVERRGTSHELRLGVPKLVVRVT